VAVWSLGTSFVLNKDIKTCDDNLGTGVIHRFGFSKRKAFHPLGIIAVSLTSQALRLDNLHGTGVRPSRPSHNIFCLVLSVS
jgi:hypothetical protein